VAHVDLEAAEPGRLEAAGGQRDHLRIRDRAAGADELGADLVGLQTLVEAAGVGRHDRPRVAEADGQRG
jgi:hypothetical protein